MPFFNYTVHAHDLRTAGYWPRREFLRAWWSLYRDDSRWTPPEYGRLRAALDPRRNDHRPGEAVLTASAHMLAQSPRGTHD